MENLSDAEKREMAMKCNFNCLLIMTTSAVCCGLAATSWCAFAQRDITLVSGMTIQQVCANNSIAFTSTAQCQSFFDNHAVGFWAWQAVVPENQLYCLQYTQYISGQGYVTLPTDTKFNTARASASVATFFGLLAFFTLIFATCCPLSRERMAGMSCYYFIATFFQGLSFLIFASNACEKGFFEPWFQGSSSNIADSVESVSCSLAKGGKLAVSACVLYFFCMCSVPVAQPPTPMDNPFAKREVEEDAAAAPAPAPEPAAGAGGEDP